MKKVHSFHDYEDTYGWTACRIPIIEKLDQLREVFVSRVSLEPIEVSSQHSDRAVTCTNCIRVLKKQIASLQKKIEG